MTRKGKQKWRVGDFLADSYEAPTSENGSTGGGNWDSEDEAEADEAEVDEAEVDEAEVDEVEKQPE